MTGNFPPSQFATCQRQSKLLANNFHAPSYRSHFLKVTRNFPPSQFANCLWQSKLLSIPPTTFMYHILYQSHTPRRPTNDFHVSYCTYIPLRYQSPWYFPKDNYPKTSPHLKISIRQQRLLVPYRTYEVRYGARATKVSEKIRLPRYLCDVKGLRCASDLFIFLCEEIVLWYNYTPPIKTTLMWVRRSSCDSLTLASKTTILCVAGRAGNLFCGFVKRNSSLVQLLTWVRRTSSSNYAIVSPQDELQITFTFCVKKQFFWYNYTPPCIKSEPVGRAANLLHLPQKLRYCVLQDELGISSVVL